MWSFSNLIEVFEKQRKEIKNRSILIISHQERILNIADEIVVLKDGCLENQGKKEDVLPELLGTASAVQKCRGVLD